MDSLSKYYAAIVLSVNRVG